MNKLILILLSITMLGFYSCTKDDDDNDDGTGTTPVEITNYISIDGTKTELTKDIVVEEVRYYMVDDATNDTTFLSQWSIYIGSKDLEIGDPLSGIYTGLYAQVYSLDGASILAGNYVANADDNGIVPSYTLVGCANEYDFNDAGSFEAITGDNDMVVTVSGDNTTIKFTGTSDSKAIEIDYTAKLNTVTLDKSKLGRKELKF